MAQPTPRARAAPAARCGLWRLLALHLRADGALPALELAQATSLARATTEVLSGAPAELPSMQLLASLSWLPRGQLRAMAEYFPLELLQLPHPARAVDAGDSMCEAIVPPQPCDPLCCLLVLQCLLRVGVANTRAWVETGAVGFAMMSLAAEALLVRRIGFDILANYMGTLERAPSFRERPQVLRGPCRWSRAGFYADASRR